MGREGCPVPIRQSQTRAHTHYWIINYIKEEDYINDITSQ